MFKVHRTFTLETGVKNNSIAVFRNKDEVSVIYHQTVVFYAKAGRIIIENGGWDTQSTRIVINRALELYGVHAHLYRKKNKTHLAKGADVVEFNGCAILRTRKVA